MAGPPPRTPCPECGARVPDIDGPVHTYVPAAPGCWAAFGRVQVFEMEHFGYPDAHRTVVDAYMAQHPGPGTDRRQRQSVTVHLVGICARFEHGLTGHHGTHVLRDATQGRPNYRALAPRASTGEITVVDMIGPDPDDPDPAAADLGVYTQRAEAWALAVWQTWKHEHDYIRSLVRV